MGVAHSTGDRLKISIHKKSDRFHIKGEAQSTINNQQLTKLITKKLSC